MATIPHTDTTSSLREEKSAQELFALVEEFFDEIGLSAAQRAERYDRLSQHLDSRDAARAKS